MAELDWEDIKFLGVVAKTKTARGAAKVKGVHHATVSRRIDSLEHAAKSRLLLRTASGYTLTEAGELLVAAAEAMDKEVMRASRLIAGGDKEIAGSLVVTMAAPVANLVFAPRLSEFCERYPKLEVSIVSSDSMANLERREADLAIRLSDQPDDSLFGKRLFSYMNAAYASNDYLNNHSVSGDLPTGRWIGWDVALNPRPDWVKNTEFPDLPVWGAFPDLMLQTKLAVSGLGIAYLPCIIGDMEPDLVRVPGSSPQQGREVWMLTHGDLRNVSRIRSFMSFAEEVLTQNKPLFQGEIPE